MSEHDDLRQELMNALQMVANCWPGQSFDRAFVYSHRGELADAALRVMSDTIERLTRERDEARDQAQEARAETRLIAQGAADANSLIDAIADLCGVPHDEELRRSHVSKALAEARAAAIEDAARVAEENEAPVPECCGRGGQSCCGEAVPFYPIAARIRALAAKPAPEEMPHG